MSDSMNSKAKRLTIDRLDNSRGYSLDNIVWCCYRCNAIKGDFFHCRRDEEDRRDYKRKTQETK